MSETIIQRAFAGGELAPALHARADQIKYVTGLRTCRNFQVLRSGGAANRSGTRLVAQCKTTSTAVKLLRYVSETSGQSILIECGSGYFRFYLNGGQITLSGVAAYNGGTAYVIGDIVSSGGVNYYSKANQTGVAPPGASWYAMPSNILEVPSPFGTSLCYAVQSGKVITLTSGAGVVPPHELVYVSSTFWVIRQVTTAPSVAAPTGVIIAAGAPGTLQYNYKVTAGAAESYEESEPSAFASVTNIAPPTPAAPNVIQWTAPAGSPAEYYIYCDPYNNGTYGFIGTATGATSFRDIGFTPDFAVTPPLARVLFNTLNEYPRRAAYYQQRRFFANTNNNPDAIYGSRVGFTANFGVSSPLQDDDSLTFKIAGNQHSPVKHMIGLKTLVVLTDAGEWSVGVPKVPLTPTSLGADQETYVGVSDVVPVVVGNAIIYVQSRGAIVRDLRFDYQVEGLGGKDLTLFASHLFDGYTIDDMDYQQTPHSTVWCCRSDGTLLGLTYLREEEVFGWHRHDTGASGLFQHVCVVPEAGEDVVYFIVRRTIGGSIVRYIEKLERREIFDLASDAFFVDSGLSYSGTATLTVSGLDHLEGERVAVLADGQVISNGSDSVDLTVLGGSITLPTPADTTVTGYTTIHVGLPITADLETLDLDVQGSQIRDKKKRIGRLTLLLNNSSRAFKVGPSSSATLYDYNLAVEEGTDSAALFTGQAEMGIESQFDEKGRIFVRTTNPLPLEVLGVMPTVETGG